jgi:hypothetical protein
MLVLGQSVCEISIYAVLVTLLHHVSTEINIHDVFLTLYCVKAN